MLNPIAIPKSLEDICDARETAVKLFEDGLRTIKNARASIEEVSHYCFPYEADPRLSLEEFKKELDKRLWRHAFNKTGLSQYMDAKAKRQFEESLERKPPEFSMDNVRTNVLSTAQNAELMFARGLVEFFLQLSKGHKSNTNEPFKVNKKAVLTYITSNWLGKLSIRIASYGGGNTIDDMDRVIKTLDGKKHQPRSLETAINTAWAEGEPFEDEYYHIKGFKNGNAHVIFKRQDLLNKANKIIADYYNGQGLARDAA